MIFAYARGNRVQLLAANVHFAISPTLQPEHRKPCKAFVLPPAILIPPGERERTQRCRLFFVTVPSCQEPERPIFLAKLHSKRPGDGTSLRDQRARSADFRLKLKETAGGVSKLVRSRSVVGCAPSVGCTKRASLRPFHFTGFLVKHRKQIMARGGRGLKTVRLGGASCLCNGRCEPWKGAKAGACCCQNTNLRQRVADSADLIHEPYEYVSRAVPP